jgi:hypothetical protein
MLFVPNHDLLEDRMGRLDLLPDVLAPVVLGVIQGATQFLQTLGRIPQNIVHPFQTPCDVPHGIFSMSLISSFFALAQAFMCRVMDCLIEGVINTLRMVVCFVFFDFIKPPNTHLISDKSFKTSSLGSLPSTQK